MIDNPDENVLNTLIICDDDQLLNIFKKVFSNLECNCIYKHELNEVRNEIKNSIPDIIVMDLYVKGVDVLKIVREVRNYDLTKLAHVVLVANENENRKITEALWSGFDDFVFSPIKPIQLKTKLLAQIKKIRMQKENMRAFQDDFRTMVSKTSNNGENNTEIGNKLKTLESELKKTSDEKNNLSKVYEETTNKLKGVEGELKKTTDEKINLYKDVENLKNNEKKSTQKLHSAYEEKNKEVEKLSNIVIERSKLAKSKSKDSNISLDKEKKGIDAIHQIKANQTKDELEAQNKEVEGKYTEIYDMYSGAVSEVLRLLIAVESSFSSKDDIMNNYINRTKQYYDKVSKEHYKLKETYYKEKNDNNALQSLEIVKKEQSEEIKELDSKTQGDLKQISDTIDGKQKELKDDLNKISSQIDAIFEDLNSKKEKQKEVEKKWLFLLEDKYKGKYFELLDEKKELDMLIEENKIEVEVLKDQIKKRNNEIVFLREGRKAKG